MAKTLLDIQQKLEDARYLVIAAELAVPAATGDKREASAIAMVLQMAIRRFDKAERWLSAHREAAKEGQGNG